MSPRREHATARRWVSFAASDSGHCEGEPAGVGEEGPPPAWRARPSRTPWRGLPSNRQSAKACAGPALKRVARICRAHRRAGSVFLQCRTSARSAPPSCRASVTSPPQRGFRSGPVPPRTPRIALTAPKSSRQSSRLCAVCNGRDLAAARVKRSDRAGSSRGSRGSTPTHGASATAPFAWMGFAPHGAFAGNRRGHGRAWRMAVLCQHRFR